MKETLEYIKIGLLAVIAVGVVYTSFIKSPSKNKRRLKPATAQTQNSNISNPSTQPANDLTVKVDPNQQSGSTSNFNSTSVAWESDQHDFGIVKQHTENVHVFNFTNTGATPLVIEDAKGSCGCTVPEYPREPIAPGATGEILVKYSPGTQIGQQTKTVVITANTEPKVTNLYINAVVEEAPDPAL